MTNEQKTEAPERIWAKDHKLGSPEDKTWWPNDDIGGVEYTRTDLSQAAAGAAIRACAEAIDDPDFTQEDVDYVDNGHKWVLLEEAQTAILALEPEAQQALDKLLAEKDAEIARLKKAMGLASIQDQGCGGGVSPAQAFHSAQAILKTALEGQTNDR